jgi:hypothetical protein
MTLGSEIIRVRMEIIRFELQISRIEPPNSCYCFATQIGGRGATRGDRLDCAPFLNWRDGFGRTRWTIEIPLRIRRLGVRIPPSALFGLYPGQSPTDRQQPRSGPSAVMPAPYHCAMVITIRYVSELARRGAGHPLCSRTPGPSERRIRRAGSALFLEEGWIRLLLGPTMGT